MFRWNQLVCFFAAIFVAAGSSSFAQSKLNFHNVLAESQATPGFGLGLGHMNTTYGDGEISGIKTNPALLIGNKDNYQVEANYQWPTEGRELYQIGAVDSRTAKTTAGLLYSGHFAKTKNLSTDVPVKHRIHVGFAQRTGKFRLGIAGQYSAGDKDASIEAKGVRFNAGVIADVSKKLKIGASGENLGSKKLAAIAPTTFRSGISYAFSNGFELQGNYMRRRLVEGEFTAKDKDWIDTVGAAIVANWKSFFIAGAFARELQPLWTAGDTDPNKKRSSISGSAGFEQKNFRLSYSMRAPKLGTKLREQAVQIGYAVKI